TPHDLARDAEHPAFLALDLSALCPSERGIAREQLRQFAAPVEGREMGGEVAHLGGVLDFTRAARRRHQRRIDLSHDPPSVAPAAGRGKPGLERPDADVMAERGIVAERAEHGDARQRLAAGRARARELPAGLRTAHPLIDQAMLGKGIAAVPAMMLRLQVHSRGARWATPEGISVAGQSAVEGGPNGETVVAVVRLVDERACDLVPDRAPGSSGKTEARRKPRRIPEREIVAGEHPLA